MKRERSKVIDIITPIKGFFYGMNYDFKIIEKQQLDLLFFNFYAQRTISPFCNYYLNESDDSITDDNLVKLGLIIQQYYQFNWDKLMKVIETEYDPIHNFSDTIHEDIVGTDDNILTKNNTLNQQGNGSVKRTDNLNSVDTKDLSEVTTGANDALIAGFNSSSYKNANQEKLNTTVKTTGTDSVQNTGTQMKEEQRNFQNINEGKEVVDNDYTKKRDMTRIGNIGNITTQQMLQQEIDLWKWNFIKNILEDVKNLTTLTVYSK